MEADLNSLAVKLALQKPASALLFLPAWETFNLRRPRETGRCPPFNASAHLLA